MSIQRPKHTSLFPLQLTPPHIPCTLVRDDLLQQQLLREVVYNVLKKSCTHTMVVEVSHVQRFASLGVALAYASSP